MAFLTTNNNKTPLGIYVHVPFCKSKCQYCDFYSRCNQDERTKDSYLKAVCAHIRESGPLAPNYRVDTVYFGGGTPSYFGADGLAMILTEIRRAFDVTNDAEITFEANPDSVSDALLKRLRAEGFNRVSLGIQCDDDEILQRIGRVHTFEQAVDAFQRIRKAGFKNVSVDLMYGLPGQSLVAWQDTLENVLRLRPEHVSCYGLTLYPGTPLYDIQDRCNLPDDDAQADMYLSAVDILHHHGYHQYEISNFAKAGKRSRHNLKYWMGGEYLGFGPSAASDFAGKRFKVISHLNSYVRGIAEGGQVLEDVEEVPFRERAGEYLMLRMRTTYGISKEEYEKKYLLDFGPLQKVLEQNQRYGLTRFVNDRWQLTPEGFLVSNRIIEDLQLAQEHSESFARRR